MDKWVCGPIKTVIVAPSTNPARTSMGNLLQHVSMKLTGQGARNDKIHHLVKVPDTDTCNTAIFGLQLWAAGNFCKVFVL